MVLAAVPRAQALFPTTVPAGYVAAAASSLPAPPTAELQARALKQIAEVFADEYAQKTMTPRLALAKKLLQQGIETRDDGVMRFVLLREARDLAADVSDAPTVLAAIGEMGKWYAVDTAGDKLAALSKATNPGVAPATAKTLAQALARLGEEAAALDNYDYAIKVIAQAQVEARLSKEAVLVAALDAKFKELQSAQAEFPRVKAALDKLRLDPADVEGNQCAGQFFCFRKGDWERGLGFLEHGSVARCGDWRSRIGPIRRGAGDAGFGGWMVGGGRQRCDRIKGKDSAASGGVVSQGASAVERVYQDARGKAACDGG